MKNYLLAALSLILAASCSYNKNDVISEHQDSITLVLDSLYKINIAIPPVFDKTVFDSSATAKFFELALATGGDLKMVVKSHLIVSEINGIIDQYAEDNADILFLIDNTGSMIDDIASIRQGLKDILSSLKKHQNIRLAIASYGDKNSDSATWYSYRNFERDFSATSRFIENIQTTGGGDWPESVYDGFFRTTTENFWRSQSKRMIILIGDAPPLEKPLSHYTLKDVVFAATKDNIKMNFYPIVVSPGAYIEEAATPAKVYTAAKIIKGLYPNPAFRNVNVQFEVTGEYVIEVYNVGGNLLFKDKLNGRQYAKDVSGLSNGAYVLRAIHSSGKYESIKFIVYK